MEGEGSRAGVGRGGGGPLQTGMLSRNQWYTGTYRSSGGGPSGGGDLAIALAAFPFEPLFPFFLLFPMGSWSGGDRLGSCENEMLSPRYRLCWRNESSELAGGIQMTGASSRQNEKLQNKAALKTFWRPENGKGFAT